MILLDLYSMHRNSQKKPAVQEKETVMTLASFEQWFEEVRKELLASNMDPNQWQMCYPFDFLPLFRNGALVETAAGAANRYWWYRQNKDLGKNCKKDSSCWLPDGHAGRCVSV